MVKEKKKIGDGEKRESGSGRKRKIKKEERKKKNYLCSTEGK